MDNHPASSTAAPSDRTRSLGLTTLVLSSLATAWLIPKPTAELAMHPTFSTGLGTLLVFTWLIAAPGTRFHSARIEKYLVATILAFMPVVYVNSLLLTRAGYIAPIGGFGAAEAMDASWLGIELIGIPIFLALAVVGARKAPWLLGVGILVHGIVWDSLHIGRTPFMPDWYAVACLIIDVGWGVWALTRARAWQSA